MNELVSIGMPTFNGGLRFERALLSAVNQTYSNIEIVVSNNSSEDNTFELVESVKKKYPNVRINYFEQNENIGPTKNFEFVLNHSVGEFFIWLAHDDYLIENYIDTCIAEFRSDKSLVLVAGQVEFEGAIQLKTLGQIEYLDRQPEKRITKYVASVTDNSIFYGLMKKSALTQIRISNCLGSDWIIVTGLLRQGTAKSTLATKIIRRTGGTSDSIEKILRTLNLPSKIAFYPYLNIANSFFREIIKRDSIYSSLGPKRQLILAIKVFMLIIYYKNKLRQQFDIRFARFKSKWLLLAKELCR